MVEQLKTKIINYENKYIFLVNKFQKKENELLNLKIELDKFYKIKNKNL